MKPLNCAKKGTIVRIQCINSCPNCKRHLEEMGLKKTGLFSDYIHHRRG